MNKLHVNRHLQDIDKPTSLISWSKNGFIAYAPTSIESKDNLLLTYLYNDGTSSWQLAEPKPINVKLENNFASVISLVCWSTLSTDLAVSDVYGNFYILLSGVKLIQKNEASPNYELTSFNHMEMIYRDIINQDIKSAINPSASIIAFKWLNIEKHQLLNKPAKLENNEYVYGVSQYPAYGATHPISTKQACVALRKNGQFILYYQGEHKVEYHKTMINLDVSFVDKASIGFSEKDIIITMYDSLSNQVVTYLVKIDWGYLVESAKKQKVDPHYQTPKESQKPPKLTKVKLHQMIPENDISSIDIISVTAQKSPLNLLISCSSTIYRYQIKSSVQLISDAFLKNSNDEDSLTLQLQDKLVRNGVVQTILAFDSHILIVYTNGSIDVIDSEWKLATQQTTITSFFEAGCTLPKLNPNSVFAVSPNMAAVAYTEIYSNDKLKIEPLVKQNSIDIAFAYRYAYSCYTNSCSDDLLLLVDEEDANQLIKECHKALSFQSDSFNKDSADKLLSNPPLQKLLSLQYTLGSQVAGIVLNLRSTSFAIMFTLSSIYRQLSKKKEDGLQDEMTRAECILSLIGNVQWLVDLIACITQELHQLTLKNTTHNVALPLLINKIPRLFLMYAISSMGKFYEIIKKFHNDVNLLKPMKESSNRFFLIYDPILFQNFQSFLLYIDALITKQYNQKEELIINPQVDQEIQKSILERFSLINSKENKIRELFLYDTSALSDSTIDGLRKIVINNDKVRRCTRCRAISLVKDPLVYDQSVPLWTMVFHRNCICGNTWVNV